MGNKIKNVFGLILIVWTSILVLFIFLKGYEFDESTHSLVGIFIKDLIIDWIKNPTFSFQKIYNYAVSYLVYYPKISLHYPPLPQIFFAISYMFFEESIVASRIITLIFSISSIILIYYITLDIYKKKEPAIISCLILITSPIIILFSTRAVQEIFFFFFFTSAIFSYIKLFKKSSIKQYVFCIILTVACVLTKWHAVTILPVIFLYTLFFYKKKTEAMLICIIFTLIILAPYYLFLYKIGIIFLPFESNIYGAPEAPQWYQISGWLYYVKTLIFESFFPLIGIFLLISSFYYIRKKEKLWDLFLIWIIAVYIIMTFVMNKASHYIINIIPALVIPSSFVVYKYITKKRTHTIVFILILIVQFVYSLYLISYGVKNVQEITQILEREGNIGIITDRGSESPFIFEMARKDRFNRQVFRPCLFLDSNRTSNEIIENYNVRYMLIMWEELNIEELHNIANEINESSSVIEKFDNYVVYEYDQNIEHNETICNYICSNKQIVCSKFKKPSDALK